MNIVKSWFRRWTENPQAMVLVMILVVIVTVVLFFGNMLTPVIAALVIAYLLDGVVMWFMRLNMRRGFAVALVFLLFLGLVIFTSFRIIPVLISQLTQLAQEIPNIINQGQALLLKLPENYPNLIDEALVVDINSSLRQGLGTFSQTVLSYAGQSVVSVINLLIYAILVPLLIFFFLKDKDQLFSWFSRLLPKDRDLADSVGMEINEQISNYVRGKAWEILIVWSVSYLTFSYFGLNYNLLLSFVVGLSVIIPYIGATVVTVPVCVVAYIQWGISPDFFWLVGAYLVIQILDGNVLVPVLFSEVMNLHPIAIILALLMFGGLWGFWGIFFAIPLATVVNAILRAWPRDTDDTNDGIDNRDNSETKGTDASA